jgi:hypothetical protein
MARAVPIPVEETLPDARAMMESQGIPPGAASEKRTEDLARGALEAYRLKSRPAGIMAPISREEFGEIFEGDGRNHAESPVGPIAARADSLALFAVTLGEGIGAEISRLFREGDFAEGWMLDVAASEGAERAAQLLEERFRRGLIEGRGDSRRGVLRFSPGYCGWDLSGQKALFRALGPAEIGLRLGDSFLMRPLKSISGVLVAGSLEIFEFEDAFAFCADCVSHECRERLRRLREGAGMEGEPLR